jgi:predicted RNA binding protein YcfA (HicA-like mRNA interferase family)
MKSSDLIREVEDAGWELKRISGSHHIFKHPSKRELITIPHPTKDVSIGVVKDTLKKLR